MKRMIRTTSLVFLTGLLASACTTIPEQLKGALSQSCYMPTALYLDLCPLTELLYANSPT